MKVAVTGASGHIGANLVRKLLEQGRDVRVVVRGDTRGIDGLPVERVPGDVSDRASLERAFTGVQTVFHLAAFISISGGHGGKVRATNVDGVRNAAEAALTAGVQRFVHCSSVHAFDLHGEGMLTESSPRSTRPDAFAYDRSKYDGEQEVRAVVAKGLSATIVNPTGVIGPLDFKRSRMGGVFVDLALRKYPVLPDGGFDFVDVRDVVDWLIAAETRGGLGENHLLGGHWLPVPELGKGWSEVTGVPPPALIVPNWVGYLGVPFAAFQGWRTGTEPKVTLESLDVLRTRMRVDNAKACRVLDHSPRPLRDTYEAIFKWLIDSGRLPASMARGSR